jgi:hypothetical protein
VSHRIATARPPASGRAARAPAALALLAATALAATPPELAPAVAAAERGDHAECARRFAAIAAAAEGGLARRARYGEAVCAALDGDLQRGFAALAAAIALDFHDAGRFYDDPRLRPLRADARWPELERQFHEAVDRWRAGLDAELHALYLADQEDRAPRAGGVDWSAVAGRDRERLRRGREILAARRAELGADDLYHAAIVLQHGEEVEDFALAHELARRAAELDADHPRARWLAAAALDRALVAAGQPQRYGTQSVFDNGRWVLAPVDPAVRDEERAAWDVPPLAESLARVETMNGPAAPPASPAAAPPDGE